jgi:hypothetical protein
MSRLCRFAAKQSILKKEELVETDAQPGVSSRPELAEFG